MSGMQEMAWYETARLRHEEGLRWAEQRRLAGESRRTPHPVARTATAGPLLSLPAPCIRVSNPRAAACRSGMRRLPSASRLRPDNIGAPWISIPPGPC
jgi:hypothetical protein